MRIRIIITLAVALMLLGLATNLGCGSTTSVPSLTAATGGFGDGGPATWGGGGRMLQEGSDDTEPSEEEPSEDEPSEDEPEEPMPMVPPRGMSDVAVQPGPVSDQNLQDALAGIRDYEVGYDVSLSRAELTPPELRVLGVTYAGEESPVAQRTATLNTLDLLVTLEDRYEVVEDQYGADPDEDFAPDDPERDLNYYQPRGDPFIIPDLIPDELRPELAGTGLDGAVDPEVLDQLWKARFETDLRMIPITVVGVMQTGPYRGVIYTLWGSQSYYIEIGDRPHCWGSGRGTAFSLSPAQISEDYVVLRLVGMYDWRCRYPATNAVYRTFNIPR